MDITLPIGVFDSGVGGLTVLRALQQRLPHERFLYLGDTARLPYGTKSPDSVLRYSLQAAQFLVRRGIKCLVVACNTASSVAIEALRVRLAPLPVIGVIDPGAMAACSVSSSGQIGVLATEGTVQGGAYQRAIAVLRPEAIVVSQSCSLLVALAEEGWTEGPIVDACVRRYLDPMFTRNSGLDTLLLGCTHFPLLLGPLRSVVDGSVTIVDSAASTAQALAATLERHNLCAQSGQVPGVSLMATDAVPRFARVGGRFLGQEFSADQVELVDLVF